MKIDQYISELLYQHDCVIVTDLGGFITNYKPASVNPALNVLSPPSKKLAFNASLKNNDGLLANHIAHRTMLNYMDACEVIRDYVNEATSGMRNGQKLKIDKIGVLYADQEGRLQFLPDHHANYLIESFGLTPVHAPLIKREMPEVPVREVASVHNITPVNTKPKRELRIFGWKVLEMIPAAAILTFLIMTPPVLKEFNTNLSTLLPFSRMDEFLETIKGDHQEKQQVVIPQINPFEIPPVSHSSAASASNSEIQIPEKSNPAVNESDVTSVENEKVATGFSTSVPVPAASSVPSSVEEESVITEPAVAVSTAVAVKSINQQTYYVIGGCFRSLENAEKLVSEMKLKGMEAEIIGQNSTGLYMVSLFSSSSFNQTTDVLPEIKSNAVETAWVYKK